MHEVSVAHTEVIRHPPKAVPDMISSSTGPSGVELTGFATGWALRLEAPQRPKNPGRCLDAVAVCVDEVSERMLGEGEAAFEVAGVA